MGKLPSVPTDAEPSEFAVTPSTSNRKLDKILVVDLESTCWAPGQPHDGEPEIIEIGLCVLEVSTLERREARCLIVRPERSTVSQYCTALTTLTQKEVSQGISFGEACAILRDRYGSQQRTWASYGDYDRQQVEKQCREQGIEYPFGPRHINVKNLFAVACGLSREVGLDAAMHMMGWNLEGTHHRGVDDAWNIAHILAHLLQGARSGLPDRPKSSQREVARIPGAP